MWVLRNSTRLPRCSRTTGSATEAHQGLRSGLRRAPRRAPEHVLPSTPAPPGLFLAVEPLEIGEGDEVVLPSLSFLAAANAVDAAGGRRCSATWTRAPSTRPLRTSGGRSPSGPGRWWSCTTAATPATSPRSRAVPRPRHPAGRGRGVAPASSVDGGRRHVRRHRHVELRRDEDHDHRRRRNDLRPGPGGRPPRRARSTTASTSPAASPRPRCRAAGGSWTCAASAAADRQRPDPAIGSSSCAGCPSSWPRRKEIVAAFDQELADGPALSCHRPARGPGVLLLLLLGADGRGDPRRRRAPARRGGRVHHVPVPAAAQGPGVRVRRRTARPPTGPSDRTLCLPLHQGLDEADVLTVTVSLRKALENRRAGAVA